MNRFHNLSITALLIFGAQFVRAEPIFPSAIGTTWTYQMTDYPSTGARPAIVIETLAGKEKIKDKDVLRLERRVDNALQKTDFIFADERGLFCLRTIANGKTINFNPPQELFPAALKFGAKWERDEEIANSEIHEQFAVKVEEDIEVPAGKFHSFLCESEQPWPISMTIQRWISPSVGVVKDVTTTRGPTGRLLGRTTTVLQKFSRAVAPPNEQFSTPTSSPSPASAPSLSPAEPPRFTLLIAAERDGPMTTDLSSKTENIFVRWLGENLPTGAQVRVAWIAEDVGDIAPPNFVVDQSDTTVEKAESGAQFTLSRPKDGWAAGQYRVELLLDGKVMDTARVKISD